MTWIWIKFFHYNHSGNLFLFESSALPEYINRVLSRIYRLGEKSWVGKGHELPRGVRGHATLVFFWNEYALRCNLVHFETQFWEMCTDLVASGWFFRYSYLYTVMITIFLGGSWAFCGGSFYPSNTLDRTLDYGAEITPQVIIILLVLFSNSASPIKMFCSSRQDNPSIRRQKHWKACLVLI